MRKSLSYYDKSHPKAMTSSLILDLMEKLVVGWLLSARPHETSKALYSMNLVLFRLRMDAIFFTGRFYC